MTEGTIVRPDGVTVAYEDVGSGPLVVLTHGFTVTLRMWDPTVAALVAAGYRVVTWDVRGHGATGGPADDAAYTIDHVVADLAALLDEVAGSGDDAEPVVLGGLSFGGYLALAAWGDPAIRRRIRALVLADTGPGFRNAEAREQWNETARKQAAAIERKGLAALTANPAAGSDVIHGQLGLDRHADLGALARAVRGFLTQHDSRGMDALPTIDVPTLIVVGEHDTPFLRASDVMAERIAGARKVVIPGAGHVANLDQPAAFDAAVLDFLGGLPR